MRRNIKETKIDILVVETLCQSFSQAKHRLVLDDLSDNLTLHFIRIEKEKQSRWIVWKTSPESCPEKNPKIKKKILKKRKEKISPLLSNI